MDRKSWKTWKIQTVDNLQDIRNLCMLIFYLCQWIPLRREPSIACLPCYFPLRILGPDGIRLNELSRQLRKVKMKKRKKEMEEGKGEGQMKGRQREREEGREEEKEKVEFEGLRGSQTCSAFHSCFVCIKDFTLNKNTITCSVPYKNQMPIINPILKKRNLSNESTQ